MDGRPSSDEDICGLEEAGARDGDRLAPHHVTVGWLYIDDCRGVVKEEALFKGDGLTVIRVREGDVDQPGDARRGDGDEARLVEDKDVF